MCGKNNNCDYGMVPSSQIVRLVIAELLPAMIKMYGSSGDQDAME